MNLAGMRAVRCQADGIVTVTTDRPHGDGHRVRVTSAGICGSDLHALATTGIPVVPGHEFGGTLDDGSLVAVRPYRPCGDCRLCARGDEHVCRNVVRAFHGMTMDGGLAEEVMVAAECVVPVPAGVSPAAVALVEPIAVAVHAINRAALNAGERVLVVGGGAVGLLCAAVLIDRGIDVDVVARHSAQANAARSIGAGKVRPLAKYDAVVDAAGTESSFAQAIDQSARGGRIVMVAVPWEPVSLTMITVLREIAVIPAAFYGHHAGEDEFRAAAEMLARNPHLPSAVVTHHFTLDDAAEAFRVAGDRAAGAIKVHLSP